MLLIATVLQFRVSIHCRM